jgi:uncharacterized repeat protein (TIGR03847 family)
MEMGPVDRITTDAVGEPGQRTFYLQVRAGGDLVTVVVEKEQVVLLSQSVLELLADVPLETGALGDADLALEEPIDPRFRAGRLSIGYDPDQDRFLLEITEYDPNEDEQDEEGGVGPEEEPEEEALIRSLTEALADDRETIRLWASREQMLALSRHGAEVAERGRPTCRFCGNPIDPEGHVCPATNGHRAPRA